MKIVFDQELIITSGREVIVQHPPAGKGASKDSELATLLPGLLSRARFFHPERPATGLSREGARPS